MCDFKPLGENSIRLLQIQPARKDGHIACILNQYDDHIPPYDALSYYWGDQKPTRKIYVNESLVDIHEALWEFLDQMQQCQGADTCSWTNDWIWTDFLSLNQSDHTEMGQQVPRMGHVYSKAERTISWLGCNQSSWISQLDGVSTCSNDLEECFRIIAAELKVNGPPVKSFFAQPELLRWTDVMKLMLDLKYPVDPLHSSSLGRLLARDRLPEPIKEVRQLSSGNMAESIRSILSVPYWTRVWIAQEVALAKEVMLVFGGAILDFNDFLLMYKSYCYFMYKVFRRQSVELRVPVEARAAFLEKNTSFRQVLHWGQHCNASKSVDRIYGLLGLLERCGDGTDTRPSILARPIDYDRDWREVFWEIALTYNPLSDPSVISGDKYREVVTRWVKFLPGLGQSLSCPFTRESLQFADNERATPLCKKKAGIALDVIDICRHVSMAAMRVRILNCLRDTSSRANSTSSWPAKLGARQLWSDPLGKNSIKSFRDSQLLLSTLLIDTAEIAGMDEDAKYQAAVIGLRMLKGERREGRWTCVPQQNMKRPLEHNIEFYVKCEARTDSSQLPCSSHSTTSSTPSSELSHSCRTSHRYLEIPRTGWMLYFRCVHNLGEGRCWLGILNVNY